MGDAGKAEARHRRARVKAFLATTSRTLAERLVNSNPWLCDELGIDLAAWATPMLEAQGLPQATLHLMGSAATGFSLRTEQAGRPFRQIGDTERPSDLDLGVVDEELFDSCWSAMLQEERGIAPYLAPRTRAHVYWGRIDNRNLPARVSLRSTLRGLQDAVTRSREFRGYPASVRVYRHLDDLIGYTEHSIQTLVRSISNESTCD